MFDSYVVVVNERFSIAFHFSCTKTDTDEKGCVPGVESSAIIPPERRYPDEEDGYGWMELGIEHMEAAAEEFRFGLFCQMKGTAILKRKSQY